MEECPYCGAQNEADAVQCGNCQAILREVDEEEMSALEQAAEKREEAQTTTVGCPKCETRNSPKARRCVECGYRIEAAVEVADHSSFQNGIYAAIAGVVGVIFLILFLMIMFGGSADRQHSKTPVGVVLKFSPARIKSNKTKRQKEWDKYLLTPYVKWSAVVVKIDGDYVDFAVGSSAIKAKKAEIQVEFDELPDNLELGKRVKFSAKLMAYNEDDYNMKLEEGLPIDEE